MSMLKKARKELIVNLRPKKADYLRNYYDPRKHQFIYAYIKLLPNLGAKSIQRTEGMHPVVKELITKHTTIQDNVLKIALKVKNIFADRVKKFNKQRIEMPRVMNKKVFANIDQYLTHKIIDLLNSEWVVAMQ